MKHRFAITALALAIPVAVVLAPSAAMARSVHAGSSTPASCSANPTTVGSSYIVAGTNLPASTMVQFLVTDSAGAESATTAMTDASGSAAIAGTAWVAGTDQVTVTDTSGKWRTLTTCSFSVS